MAQVGATSALFGRGAQQAAAATNPLLGDALVVCAQLFTALQMCLEERFCKGYNVPALVAVGWEGVWGLIGVPILLVALQYCEVGGLPVEDSLFAARQV